MASITRTLRKIVADPRHVFNVASRLRMIFTRNSIFHTSLELSNGYRLDEQGTAELKASNDIWADNLLVFER